ADAPARTRRWADALQDCGLSSPVNQDHEAVGKEVIPARQHIKRHRVSSPRVQRPISLHLPMTRAAAGGDGGDGKRYDDDTDSLRHRRRPYPPSAGVANMSAPLGRPTVLPASTAAANGLTVGRR